MHSKYKEMRTRLDRFLVQEMNAVLTNESCTTDSAYYVLPSNFKVRVSDHLPNARGNKINIVYINQDINCCLILYKHIAIQCKNLTDCKKTLQSIQILAKFVTPGIDEE